MTILGRNRGGRLLFIGTVAIAVTALTVATAAADTHHHHHRHHRGIWTVTPGGEVTGSATTVTLQDKTTGISMLCGSAATTIIFKSGTGLSDPIGEITSATFSNCMGPGGVVFTGIGSATPGNPWPLSALSYDDGVAKGTMTNIKATITGAGCSATLGGDTPTSAGYTTGNYTNSTATQQVTGGNLHIWNVSGCFGAINNGDSASLTTGFKFTPKVSITSTDR